MKMNVLAEDPNDDGIADEAGKPDEKKKKPADQVLDGTGRRVPEPVPRYLQVRRPRRHVLLHSLMQKLKLHKTRSAIPCDGNCDAVFPKRKTTLKDIEDFFYYEIKNSI